MSALITIANPLTPLMVTSSETALTGLHTILDIIKITLTKDQTKGLYRVGAIRMAETDTIYTKLMKAHPETIGTSFTLASFDALTQAGIDCDTLEAMFLALATIVGGHGAIVQSNRRFHSLQCLDNARLMGKTTPAIQTIVDEIATEFFARSSAAKKTATGYTIAPAASITISCIVTGKYFTNSGKTILSILKVGGLVADTIQIFPGSGELVPALWTRLIVTNESTLSDGGFSLYMQA